ncbi:uncharacterized protein si:dkey-250k15.4 [Labrus bergylta]|uniref:uncharacterized protein si:dkey-250k15.4 n=1 Tax=Labrus bergylta TaxID=56723 RepID=UPI003313C9A6
MSHMCGRSLSDKDRILHFFNKQSKATDKNCCLVNGSTAGYKSLHHNSKTDGQHRIKRLKSRKERCKMKGGGKEAPKSKSHHLHCRLQSSRDITYFHDRCCHSSCHCSSRRDAAFPNVVPVAQEPSIITDSRLIGHHGLFNHEVKSINIERLLSKQRKMEKSGQQVHENNYTARPSSTSPNLTPLSNKDMLDAEPDEVLTLDREADFAIKAHNNIQEKENKMNQGSNFTPGQKTNPVMTEKGIEPQLTPTDYRENVTKLNKKVKAHMISTLEQTPKDQEFVFHGKQLAGASRSPLKFSSSHTVDSLDSQQRQSDPCFVSESVSAVAASLCGCVQFPLLKKRNLVAESREVLLKALQERHGLQLQENLFRLQRCLSFGSDHTKEVQDQELTMIDEDELQNTDAFTIELQASKPLFNTLKTKPFKEKGSTHCNLKSSPRLPQNLKQMSEWFRRPEKTSASLLDDILRSPCSPEFIIDCKPSGIRDHLYAPSPTSCWEGKKTVSPHWRDSFSRPKSKETLKFHSFENSFMNQTRALDGQEYSESNTPKFLSYQSQLLEKNSAEPIYFPQEQGVFETKRYSLPPSFTSQVLHPEQSHSFRPYSQFSLPTTHAPHRSHHTDMIHYPPSHMLERDTATSHSSLLSPEHWSFPPMRLY